MGDSGDSRIKDTRQAKRGGDATGPWPGGRWALAWTVAAVALTAAGTLVWLTPRLKASPPPLRSIAVMPIRNLTGVPAMDAAADRLTRDTAAALAGGGFFITAPDAATFALRGKVVDDRYLADTLHTRNVAVASLLKVGPGYRVSVQIIDTVSGDSLVDRNVDQVARDGVLPEGRMATALSNQIGEVVRRRWREAELAATPNDRDPENVLARFDALVVRGRPEDIAQAERLLGAARAVGPADIGLTGVVATDACFYYAGLIANGAAKTPAERAAWANTALGHASRAIAAQPRNPEPHECRSRVLGLEGRWDEAIAEARQTIATFPTARNGYSALAEAEFAMGRFDDALADFSTLANNIETDPGDVGLAQLFTNRDADAIKSLGEQAELAPKDPTAPFFLAAAYERNSHHDYALIEARRYRHLRTGVGQWAMLRLSDEPAFAKQAAVIRQALHAAGLDESEKPDAPAR